MTLLELLDLLKTADIVTIYRDGSFSMIHDDHAADVRTCRDVRTGRKRAECRRLRGYDRESRTWTQHGAAVDADIPNKRGAKALDAWIQDQCLREHPHFRPAVVCLYRKDGVLQK